ncbi:M67 family metallopeptidase [Paenibacillus donghaensis]|uniref:M67 family metallopeptidase n=1 Tax=Paenibacillus donghaensis TaxID=414771 RepID=UPI0018839997|nr:M67 family metallopeptidase [Paenibacillus donghaensis]MBE9914336.1 M67 family metallopeptidase [Paenibacillus donghaensis]
MPASHETRQEIWLCASCKKQISEHLTSGLPYETCGVLQGRADMDGLWIDNFIPIRNAAPDPLHHFSLHPEDWTKACLRGDGLIGLFHSHPHSPPLPSSEDLRQLPLFAGMLGVYLIGSPDGDDGEIRLNGYRIRQGSDGGYALQPAVIRHG